MFFQYFTAETLPRDLGEFYQFCYVTHEAQIVGVSPPFQLVSVGSLRPNDINDEVEEEGLVVVTSQESNLRAKIITVIMLFLLLNVFIALLKLFFSYIISLNFILNFMKLE